MMIHFARFSDRDQHDVLVSTGLLVLLVVAMAPLLSIPMLLTAVPIQFLTTYLLARRRPVKCKHRACEDLVSHKTWDDTVSNAFMQAGFALNFIFGMLALAHQDNHKSLAVTMLLLPLLLTRGVLLIRKLPLAALYPPDFLTRITHKDPN